MTFDCSVLRLRGKSKQLQQGENATIIRVAFLEVQMFLMLTVAILEVMGFSNLKTIVFELTVDFVVL